MATTGCRVGPTAEDKLDAATATIDARLAVTLACSQGGENSDDACSDGIDNDGDSYIDCHDFDCCGAGLTLCANCGNHGTPSYADVCTRCGDQPPCPTGQMCCGDDCQTPACISNDDCAGDLICQDQWTCDATCVSPPVSPPAAVEKVMTYNVKQGGLDPRWQRVVEDENADIIVFVETHGWDSSRVGMISSELNNYFSTGAYEPPNDEPPYFASAEPDPPPYGGTAILSRYPIVGLERVDQLVLDDSSSWSPIRDFMIWQLDVAGTPLFVTGVHPKCCGGAANEYSRERDMEGLINWFDDNVANEGIIIAGDFNAFSYADQQADNNRGDLGYGPLEMLLDENPGDAYDSFASSRHTFHDGYRELTPTISTADHTYRSSMYSSRIDFIVVSHGLRALLTAPASVGAGTANDPGSDHWTVDVHLDFGAAKGARSRQDPSISARSIEGEAVIR